MQSQCTGFAFCGGIVGSNGYGKIANSYFAGIINCSDTLCKIGGITHSNRGNNIVNVYALPLSSADAIMYPRPIPFSPENTLVQNQMPKGFDTSVWEMGDDGYPKLK